MITLTSEHIEENWSKIKSGTVVPVSLSEWDDGDCYTLSSLGVLPCRTIDGALVLGDTPVSDFSIVIRFKQVSDSINHSLFEAPDTGRYEVTGEHYVADGIEAEDVKIEHLHDSLESRRAGLIESNLLSGRSVCIVGLGTGGVSIAVELAKAGVGMFSLIDPDRLEISNVSRHQAGLSFVGRKKVLAARDLILDANPAAQIDVYPIRAESVHQTELLSVVERSDLVVCATDNRPSKLFVNSLCVESRKPAVFGGAFRRAYGGQILRVRPHESACYHCFVLAVPEIEADREISSDEDAAAIAYSDRPVTIEPGLSLDVAPISIMASKLALQELIRNEESTLHMLDKDLDAGWYLWINRPEPGTEYASWAPLSECTDQMTILRWYGIHLEMDAGCPTCGDFGKALRDQYGVDDSTQGAPQIRSFPSGKEPAF